MRSDDDKCQRAQEKTKGDQRKGRDDFQDNFADHIHPAPNGCRAKATEQANDSFVIQFS